MKRRLLTNVCVLSGLILSGGGGELTGAGGAPTITTTPTNVSTTISSIPSQQLASFGDGASAERFVSSDGLLYTGIFDDPLLKSVIENEAYTVSGTPTSGSANGVNYQTISATQTSDAAQLDIYVNGIFLANNETVSIALIKSSSYGYALVSVGTQLTSIPASVVSYNGNASVIEVASNGAVTSENGQFTLSINLANANPVGTLSTSGMSTFQFASGNVALGETGNLTSPAGVSIGRINGTQQTETKAFGAVGISQ
jgi:secreted protein with Ig-like and vWFA domain